MEPNWLNPREDRAWRAFQHAHHQLDVHLNRGLQQSGLSGADYEVLAVLSEHDGNRMPARDLGNRLGWEKSRVSHQVRRMQQDGLICREPNPPAPPNERALRPLAKDDDPPAEDEPSKPSSAVRS